MSCEVSRHERAVGTRFGSVAATVTSGSIGRYSVVWIRRVAAVPLPGSSSRRPSDEPELTCGGARSLSEAQRDRSHGLSGSESVVVDGPERLSLTRRLPFKEYIGKP